MSDSSRKKVPDLTAAIPPVDVPPIDVPPVDVPPVDVPPEDEAPADAASVDVRPEDFAASSLPRRKVTVRQSEETRARISRLASEWVARNSSRQVEGADDGSDQEPRDGRRTAPMSFALRADLKERLSRFRADGGNINVSGICNEAIERELGRIESGNAVVRRLLVELTERRGPSWTLGYQAGRKWAEETASWLEITEWATRYRNHDVKVGQHEEDFATLPEGPGVWLTFEGRFHAPERDYGRDTVQQAAAPCFALPTPEPNGRMWETRLYEVEAYWRAWLTAVREVYEQNKDHLPSVIDELALEPTPVDPDEIPF
jgi:hypothetical protein